MAGLYIHIPFCASRCIYCGFFSTTNNNMMNRYIHAVTEEMNLRKHANIIDTIYIGGGTPSQLSSQNLVALFKSIYNIYNVRKDAEVTLECNPDDVTEDFTTLLTRLPVNRISMGVQSFSDKRLSFLHRRHTSKQAMEAVETLRNHGIQNISIDLIFGFPEETIADWEIDIDSALSLNVEHISAYSLMYEEGTQLYQLLKQGKIHEIDEETSLSMYNLLIDKLEKSGYEQYEISNFARPGFRSKHNSSYWHEVPYIGLGASAHSYNKTHRMWNPSNLTTYIQTIESGRLAYEQETLDSHTRYNDLITTALRTKEGINLTDMKRHYGSSLYQYLMNNAHQHLQNNNMMIEDEHLSLTKKGLYISDDIMSDLIYI